MGRWSTKSVLFNGTTQYGTAGNVLNFERNQGWTISGWFNSSDTTEGILVAKQGDTNPEGWNVGLNSAGNLSFTMTHTWVTNVIAKYTNASFNDGGWHHFASVFDGLTFPSSASAVGLYVDGALQATTTLYDNLVSDVANAFAFTVGRRIHASSPLYLLGALDELAVYTGALSADEVSWIYDAGIPNDLQHANAPAGLVSWWNMGENESGGVIPDQQGSNTLTLIATPTIQDDTPEGKGYLSNNQSSFPLSTFLPSNEYVPDHNSDLEDELHTFYPVDVIAGGGGGPTVYYKMRAQEQPGGAIPPPSYVTWVVQDFPDFAGAGFSLGEPSPTNPMVSGSAVVVSRWEE